MPTYSYECVKCGMTIEKFLPVSQMKDEIIGDCECGESEEVVAWKNVITSPTEFRLKGKGWYESTKNSATENVRRMV